MGYSYLLLAPKKGKYNINPASITTKSGLIKSNSLQISVLEMSAAQKAAKQEQAKSEQKLQNDAEKIIDQNLFVKVFSEKNTVYIGEPFLVTYKLYRNPQLGITGIELDRLPEFNGFWIRENKDSTVKWKEEIVNGVRFLSIEVKKYVVVPQISGKLLTDALGFKSNVQLEVNNGRRSNDIFEQFFSRSTYKNFSKLIKSPQVEIKVLPTKEPVADNFSNIVGSYTLESTIDKRKVKTNEPISLKLIIKGKGNLNFLEPPKFSNNPDLEFYDPKITDNIDYNNTISGTRTIEYIIIPRNAGKFDLEQLVVNYFDLKSRNYVELKSDKYSIEVEQGVYNDPTIQSTPLVKLQFIQNENQTRLKDKHSYLIASPFYYVLLCLPIGLIGFIWYKSKKKSQENSDIIGTKKKNAINIAKKRLSLANKYLSEGSQALFLEEILKASWLYFSDKMNIPISELSKDALSDLLKQKKVEEADINLVLEHIDNVEFYRYTPMVEDAARKELYLKTNDIIVKFEELL
jgi:hypothetical protein